MELFVALCCDRHDDEVIRIFTKPGRAIQYCKKFMKENSSGNFEIEEDELTDEMIENNWIYSASYGPGNYVRVEKVILNYYQ